MPLSSRQGAGAPPHTTLSTSIISCSRSADARAPRNAISSARLRPRKTARRTLIAQRRLCDLVGVSPRNRCLLDQVRARRVHDVRELVRDRGPNARRVRPDHGGRPARLQDACLGGPAPGRRSIPSALHGAQCEHLDLRRAMPGYACLESAIGGHGRQPGRQPGARWARMRAARPDRSQGGTRGRSGGSGPCGRRAGPSKRARGGPRTAAHACARW